MINLNGYYDENGIEIHPFRIGKIVFSTGKTGVVVKKEIDDLTKDICNSNGVDKICNMVKASKVYDYLRHNPNLLEYFQSKLPLNLKVKLCEYAKDDAGNFDFYSKIVTTFNKQEPINYNSGRFEDLICQHILLNKKHSLKEAIDLNNQLLSNPNIKLNEYSEFKLYLPVEKVNAETMFEVCNTLDDFQLGMKYLPNSEAFNALEILSKSNLPDANINILSQELISKVIQHEASKIDNWDVLYSSFTDEDFAPIEALHPIIKQNLIDGVNHSSSIVKDNAYISPILTWGMEQVINEHRSKLLQPALEVFKFFKSLIKSGERAIYQICSQENNEFLNAVKPPQDKSVRMAIQGIEAETHYDEIRKIHQQARVTQNREWLDLYLEIAKTQNDTKLEDIICNRIKTLDREEEIDQKAR